MLNCKLLDTMVLAQELLRGELPNYKLNSLADYYGFTFNHHRAFDDACVTAKVFTEFIKKRGKLPPI
jgi:DNA polymerase-3 subunit alpha (Gram-positive type)